MTAANKCRECAYWDPEGAPRKGTGFCRRFPPSANGLLVPVKNFATAQQDLQMQTMTNWPVTTEQLGCGEFKIKLVLARH